MNKRLKIFDYTWHIPDQYDLIVALRETCDFYHCLNSRKQWDTTIRPVPENLTFVASYCPGLYDVAILHIDQQVVRAESNKRMIYCQFDELIRDIPKLVINHGSPVVPDELVIPGDELSEYQMRSACIAEVRRLVGTNTMVVNSYTATSEAEWGFGRPLIRGLDPNDYWDLPKEPRVFTALPPFESDTYYNRPCMIQTADILYDRYRYILSYAGLNVDTGNSQDAYKMYLGKSLLYIDTSTRTPLNRARTEALLSGCCVIQVEKAHDLERWAKTWENMILVPDDPGFIADLIIDLLENRYEEALEIGKRGKEMAIREFGVESYRAGWLQLFREVMANDRV